MITSQFIIPESCRPDKEDLCDVFSPSGNETLANPKLKTEKSANNLSVWCVHDEDIQLVFECTLVELTLMWQFNI